VDFDLLKSTFIDHLTHGLDSSVLVLGCGNSAVSEDLCTAGFRSVLSVDISEVAINLMRKRAAERSLPTSRLRYETMDCLDMRAVDSGSMQLVLDKGLADAILFGANGLSDTVRLFHEVYRVLENGGVFVMYTYRTDIYRQLLQTAAIEWKETQQSKMENKRNIWCFRFRK
jgi:SAM-dependent methyltransferase